MGALERGLGYELVPLSDEDTVTQESQYDRRAPWLCGARLMAICGVTAFTVGLLGYVFM